jgi:hypothetical protein
VSTAKKIAQLQRLLDQASRLTVRDADDAAFKSWKDTVERTLIRVFGEASPEVKQFSKLTFFYHAAIMVLGKDYSHRDRQEFDRDFDILLSSIRNYIEELQQDGDDATDTAPESTAAAKTFISHATKDAPIVEELIELLEVIGLPSDRIFCSSFAGYGIDLGDNFLDALKEELSNDTLVLFVLSHNFYASPVCLCEMGATWVQTKDHIPILVPPFNFADIKSLSENLRVS